MPRPDACLRALAIGLACACLACFDAPGLELPAADPDRVEARGLSAPRRAAIDAFLSASARLGYHAGYVAAFARDGRIVHTTATGFADLEAETPMTLDTRFRMASMTKPITAVAALILVEEGRLDLEDPVSRYVPSAASLRVATASERGPDGRVPTEPLRRPLSVRDLLTFRAGIGSEAEAGDLGALWAERDIYAGEGSLSDRVERILEAPLFEQPGTRWRYGWSADVLARVVEVAAGEPFDVFLEKRIFDPLGMTQTSFLPRVSDAARIARMYTQDAAGDLVPVPVPASDAPDWTPGGSGLVSTAGDYMRFALMLWNRGRYAGVRILAPETVDAMTWPQVESGVLADQGIDGLGWGYGVAVVVDASATPTPDHDGDFWWSGYYGTTFFVSSATGIVGVVLAQNQPGPHSPLPYAIYIAPAFAGLGQ